MTPQEIIDAARRGYNASSSDPFFSDQQLLEWIYQACMELAKEGFLIEKVATTTTTSGTQEYAFPTNAFAIKKLTYDGEPLEHMSFREDDLLTGGDQDSTTTGDPLGYVTFAQVIYLRPLPDSSTATLKIWSYNHPSGVPTVTSTLDIPDEWHIHLTNFLLREMSAKNKNYEGARYYGALWAKTVQDAIEFGKKKQRGSNFRIVQNTDVLPTSILGVV
jgi:hypothetical protein